MAPGADLALDWGGGRLWLCPERAAFAPDHAVLLVADFHLGKAHSFRRLGVPVLIANEQELAAHETVLKQIDKDSKGKTVWRVLEPVVVV